MFRSCGQGFAAVIGSNRSEEHQLWLVQEEAVIACSSMSNCRWTEWISAEDAGGSSVRLERSQTMARLLVS